MKELELLEKHNIIFELCLLSIGMIGILFILYQSVKIV